MSGAKVNGNYPSAPGGGGCDAFSGWYEYEFAPTTAYQHYRMVCTGITGPHHCPRVSEACEDPSLFHALHSTHTHTALATQASALSSCALTVISVELVRMDRHRPLPWAAVRRILRLPLHVSRVNWGVLEHQGVRRGKIKALCHKLRVRSRTPGWPLLAEAKALWLPQVS